MNTPHRNSREKGTCHCDNKSLTPVKYLSPPYKYIDWDEICSTNFHLFLLTTFLRSGLCQKEGKTCVYNLFTPLPSSLPLFFQPQTLPHGFRFDRSLSVSDRNSGPRLGTSSWRQKPSTTKLIYPVGLVLSRPHPRPRVIGLYPPHPDRTPSPREPHRHHPPSDSTSLKKWRRGFRSGVRRPRRSSPSGVYLLHEVIRAQSGETSDLRVRLTFLVLTKLSLSVLV